MRTTPRRLLCGAVLVAAFAPALAVRAAEVPRRFDWTARGIGTAVRDQGTAPHCWAITATEALEANWAIRTDTKVVLSPQPILDRTRQGGPDYNARALEDLVVNGTAGEANYPYVRRVGLPREVIMPFVAADWGYVAEGGKRPAVAALKAALLRHGPLTVGLYATDKFNAYRGGVFREPAIERDPELINSYVLLVGWDDDAGAWKIKCSRGPTWGDKGFMWIAYGSNNVGSQAAWVEAAVAPAEDGEAANNEEPADEEPAEDGMPAEEDPADNEEAVNEDPAANEEPAEEEAGDDEEPAEVEEPEPRVRVIRVPVERTVVVPERLVTETTTVPWRVLKFRSVPSTWPTTVKTGGRVVRRGHGCGTR